MYLKIGLFLLGVVIFIGAKPYKSNMIEVVSPNGQHSIRIVATNNGAEIQHFYPSPRNDGVVFVENIDNGDARVKYIFPENFTDRQREAYEGF